MNIGFIGLGVMGFPMDGHLQAAGHNVRVYPPHCGAGAAVVEVISQGAAQSRQMEHRYRSMLAHDYQHGFTVDWIRKDLAMVLAQAETMQLSLPLTRMVDGFYAQVQQMGGGRWDTSSLLARLQRVPDA